jgi:peroxiredoxin
VQLQALKDEFAKLDTEVVAATVQPLSITAPLAKRLGVTYPIMTDTSHEVSEAYGVYNLPGGMGPLSTHSMFLIDKSGRIRWSQVSLEMHIDPTTIEQQVQDLAKQEQ